MRRGGLHKATDPVNRNGAVVVNDPTANGGWGNDPREFGLYKSTLDGVKNAENLKLRKDYKDASEPFGRMGDFDPEELVEFQKDLESRKKEWFLHSLAFAAVPKPFDQKTVEEIQRLDRIRPQLKKAHLDLCEDMHGFSVRLWGMLTKRYIDKPEEAEFLYELAKPTTYVPFFPAWDPAGILFPQFHKAPFETDKGEENTIIRTYKEQFQSWKNALYPGDMIRVSDAVLAFNYALKCAILIKLHIANGGNLNAQIAEAVRLMAIRGKELTDDGDYLFGNAQALSQTGEPTRDFVKDDLRKGKNLDELWSNSIFGV